VANSDPAFDQCNLGPPDLSWPVTDINNATPGYFKVTSGTGAVDLLIDVNAHSHRCRNNPSGDWFSPIPFLSVGAQKGNGQNNIIAYISNGGNSASRNVISFDMAITAYEEVGCRTGSEAVCTSQSSGSHGGFYMVAEWGGKKRAIFVDLFATGVLTGDFNSPNPGRAHWPFPVYESFFYPGFEMVVFSPNSLKQCGITIDGLSTTALNQYKHYTIDASKIYTCANSLGMFETEFPFPAISTPLTGFHWYIEAPGTKGRVRASIKNPTN
jgi:hypothetical protein